MNQNLTQHESIIRQSNEHKLTPELFDTFVRLVKMGNYYIACCNAVGIRYETFRSWMKMGDASPDPENIYRLFYLAVREADAYAEVYAVSAWKKHFHHDYRAARDFLARRYPSRWAEQQRITVAVDNELQRMLEALQGKLPADIYSQVILALATVRDELETQETTDLEDPLSPLYGIVDVTPGSTA